MRVYVRGRLSKDSMSRVDVPVSAADVAVFRLKTPITPQLPLEATADGMVFGQDAYFLGFPLGLTFDIGAGETFPLVKRATISGTNRSVDGRPVLLLDGWNNPGFSGGPVVFQRRVGEPFRVGGVVTAYHQEPTPLTVDGVGVTGAEVLANSGIVIAEEIARVLEAIG
jgi:trypsin-like peptidase